MNFQSTPDYIEQLFSTPKTRAELRKEWNTSDRELRIIVGRLQEYYPIVNLQDGRGYFLGNEEECFQYLLQELSRGISSAEKIQNIASFCRFSDEGAENIIRKLEWLRTVIEHIYGPLKAETLKRKNIKAVPVRCHYRKVGSGNVDGQIKAI